MKKIILIHCIFFGGIFISNAQPAATIKKALIFSAIKGTVSKPDSVILPVTAISVKLSTGDTASFKIQSRKKQNKHE